LAEEVPRAITAALARLGARVVTVASPAHGDLDGTLAHHIRTAAATVPPGQPLMLAGLSRGARISAAHVTDLGAAGLIACAYPFHPRHSPRPSAHVAVLSSLSVPVLLCQGTRDALGNREQIRGYDLPASVQVHWVADANHQLTPRRGHDPDVALQGVAQACAAFVQSLATVAS